MLAHSSSGSGRAVVFLHGISADRTRWAPVTERLQGSFRCVAVDLPGHGASPDEGCDLLSAVHAVQGLVDHLQLERPIIVGHSLGANAALLHAALHPVAGVVAVDPVPLHLPHMAARLAPYRDRLLGPDFVAAFREWEEDHFPSGLLPAAVREQLHATRDPRQDVVLAYWKNVLSPEAAAALQPGFAAALATIDAPTLVLLADPPSPEDAAVLAGIAPAVVEVWQGLGHFLHLVDPDRFADRLRRFAS